MCFFFREESSQFINHFINWMALVLEVWFLQVFWGFFVWFFFRARYYSLAWEVFSKDTFPNQNCFFTLLTTSFAVKDLSTFIQSYFSVPGVISCTTSIVFRKLLVIPLSPEVFRGTLPKFQNLDSCLWSILNWFLCRMKEVNPSFILLCVEIRFSQYHLLKRLPFSLCMFLTHLSKLMWL